MVNLKHFAVILGSSLVLGACTTSTPAPSATPTNQPSSSLSASPSAQTYTLSQVAQHVTPTDCWLAISGKVYNVSNFGEKHPGVETIYQGYGQNATALFETRPMGSGTPHSDKARSFLPNFYLGDLTN